AFSLGPSATAFPGMAAILDELETVIEQPLFVALRRVAIRDVTITIEDARSARVWQVVGGQIELVRSVETLDLTLMADVFNGTDDLARLQVSARNIRGDGRASIAVQINDVAAQDIALQSPALAVLGVLDAPISGALRATLDAG